MPYSKKKNHPECPASKPIGVVKDSDGKLMGCHMSDEDANKQMAALHANENKMADMTLMMREEMVNRAVEEYFYEQSDMAKPSYGYSCGVFDTYVIVKMGEHFWKVEYAIDESGEIVLAEQSTWVKVENAWIEAKGLKATTKKEKDGEHPPSHYLVVEDRSKPTTWHLRVRDADGKLDHRLMGAAWAALHSGYRGNTYEGPNKEDAISKLTALYEREKIDTPKKSADDEFVASFGDHILKTYIKGDQGVVEALGIRFGTADECDLEHDYFDASTDYGPNKGNGVAATLNHRMPLYSSKTTKAEAPVLEHFARQFFKNAVTTVQDKLGIVARHVLDLSDEYEKMIFELAQKGKFRWSSGSAPHMVDRDADGRIKTWHILEWAYTPFAAEPRLPVIAPMKTLAGLPLDLSEEVGNASEDTERDDSTEAAAIKAMFWAAQEVFGTKK